MSFLGRITDGLKLYELLMLVFGSLILLVVLVLLIIYSMKNRSLTQLLYVFGFGIVMLGWPSIKMIQIGNIIVDLDKVGEQGKKITAEKIVKVEKQLAYLKNREIKNPEAVEKIAKAEFMIGKPGEALQTISTLPADKKDDSSIINLASSIRIAEDLKQQLAIVQVNPADSNAVKKLNELRYDAAQLEIKNYQVDSNIKVADKKISEFKRINPGIKINPKLIYFANPNN